MASITLGNNNPDSLCSTVTIDLSTGVCTADNNLQMDCQQLLATKDFIHPLLAKSPLSGTDNMFHYQYDDLKGLLDSAINVYATLIHSKTPLDCQFKISPSPLFRRKTKHKKIYFSIRKNHVASEMISIGNLEEIVGDLSNIVFQYSDKTIIDDQFGAMDLPEEINGDELCVLDDFILGMLKKNVDLNRLEIRYIDPVMGFGVYSREVIKNGEVIGIYTGVKQIWSNLAAIHAYTFSSSSDSLNMHVDARKYGNITRFINHAFDSCPGDSGLTKANVSAKIYKLNGVEFVFFIAQKDIPKGVQLLVNYGKKYFEHRRFIGFNANKKDLDLASLYSARKAGAIRVMANHGVIHAQIWLFLRVLIISGLIVIAFEVFLFLLKNAGLAGM